MRTFLLFLFILCVWATSKTVSAAPVTVAATWGTPTEYVDGTPLLKANIAGYELRYNVTGSTNVSRILLTGSDRVSYEFDLPSEDIYDVSIAVYLTNGMYSAFTPFNVNLTGKPPQQTWFNIQKKSVDPQVACTADITCKVVF